MDASLAHLMGWSESAKGDMPPPLSGPSITISPLSSPYPPTVFLYGGKYVHTRRLSSEMWAMDLSTRIWQKIDAGEGPGPRYFHSMDTWEDKLVCFGGMSDSDPMGVHNDIWFFSCTSRRWLPPPSPRAGLTSSGTAADQDPALMPFPRYAHLTAVSRGKLLVSGGQRSDNSWIYEINVYDLNQKIWTSKTEQPEMKGMHSKGAYRSVATSSKQRVIVPVKNGDSKTASVHSYSIDEEGEGGDICCYSNYDFAKVRREIELISPLDGPSELSPPSSSYESVPSFEIRDQTFRIHGPALPPGLRFPTGAIIGNHFVMCGLYLASTSAAFSIWAMNLDTMSWRQIEPSVLGTGSWNRAVLWPEKARIFIFGNPKNDLASDYARRAVNLDHMVVIPLEAYGIYPPPKLEVPAKVQDIGLTMLDEKLASDFEVVCQDGRRIKCSRKLLSERWPWFAQQEAELAHKAAGALKAVPALDINNTLLGSFETARLTPTQLTIPESFPVCVSLVQYFYTLSLSTPLQNRAPVLSALLFLAKQYNIDRLARLVVHALHERLEPSIAVGIYEIATLSGEQNLQVRALNMIHSAKGSSSSRSHRQGPASALVGDGEGSRSNSPAKTNAAGSESSGYTVVGYTVAAPLQSTNQAQYRHARCESVTLADDDEDSLAISRESVAVVFRASCHTPSKQKPPLYPPPTGLLPQSPSVYGSAPSSTYTTPNHNGRSSRASSDVSSSYPATPSASPHDSFVLTPIGRPTPDKRPGFVFGLGLEDVPEANPITSQALNRSFHTVDGVTLTSHHISEKDVKRIPLDTATHVTIQPRRRVLPRLWGSYSEDPIVKARVQPDLPPRSDSIAATQRSSPTPDPTRHHSIGTESSTSTSDVPATPTSMSFSMSLRKTPEPSIASTRDTASIRSGSTGTSSKMAAKTEKKAIQAADKAAKKAESKAKFEAYRGEQMRKTFIARAEAQRNAESAARAAPVPKAAPKSKFGRFGAVFAESVLFPAGGENSTMV